MFSVLVRWSGRIFLLVIAAVLLLLVVNFVMVNPEQLSFNLVGYQTEAVRVSNVVIVAFILGGMLGVVVSSLTVVRLRIANANFRRKLSRRESELQKLRSRSVQGLG